MVGESFLSNARSSLNGVNLYLDIHPKKEYLQEFSYTFERPELEEIYGEELASLKNSSLEKTLPELREIKRKDVKEREHSFFPMGLSLLHRALDAYDGRNHVLRASNETLCLCFNVTKKEIVSSLLNDRDFNLKTLIKETKATSACSSCRIDIENLITKTRNENAIIPGFDHSKTHLDKEGRWLKVAGMYPGTLVVRLDELMNEWLEREELLGKLEIEIVGVVGHHVDIKLETSSRERAEVFLLALSDFYKDQLGVKLFLSRSF